MANASRGRNAGPELEKAISAAIGDVVQETIDQVAKSASARVETEVRKFLMSRLCGAEHCKDPESDDTKILCQPAPDVPHSPSKDVQEALAQANASRPMTIVFEPRCHALVSRLLVQGEANSSLGRSYVYDMDETDDAFRRDLERIGLTTYMTLGPARLADLLKNRTPDQRSLVIVRTYGKGLAVNPSLAALLLYGNRLNIDVFVLLNSDGELSGSDDDNEVPYWRLAQHFRLNKGARRALKRRGFAVLEADIYPKWIEDMDILTDVNS
ncbi:hypothetical protein [Mollivirus kamchatka]|nr:hypothetical protein [Mollivirus kamchatka]